MRLARLLSAFMTPRDSNHARIARRTCSGTVTPSRSKTSRRPSSSSSSMRNVVIRRGVTLRNLTYYDVCVNVWMADPHQANEGSRRSWRPSARALAAVLKARNPLPKASRPIGSTREGGFADLRRPLTQARTCRLAERFCCPAPPRPARNRRRWLAQAGDLFERPPGRLTIPGNGKAPPPGSRGSSERDGLP